jgi:hypothetical protein
MTQAEGPRDIITELSGVDSRHRISSKYAAMEILHEGQFLFDVVLDRALHGSGSLAVRCAEACSRAARKNPGLAEKRSKDIISYVLKKPEGDMRYFSAAMLTCVKIPKKQSLKCAALLEKWLFVEKEKGPRACYLETIAALARSNAALWPLASSLIEEALKSPVPSYSARARIIVMKMKKMKSENSRDL